MQASAPALSTWAARRRRAAELAARYPFAEEPLRLYGALLQAQERAYDEATSTAIDETSLLPFVKERVLPRILDVTLTSGPGKLRADVVARLNSADLDEMMRRWLAGAEQAPVDRYLARATLAPVLEARPDLHSACRGTFDARHCPSCGGPPQVSYLPTSEEALVSAPRRLVCARCETSWSYPRIACVACGERAGERLRVLEEEQDEGQAFPHLRLEACDSCRHYVVTVDMRRASAAVPVVDDIAAIPLHLIARDHGLERIVTNLMGF